MPDIEAIEIVVRGLRFPALSCGQGPLVLLQHGFPDLPQTFASQLRALAAAGYRAVAPTLRGYHRLCLTRLTDVHIGAAADDLVAFVTALGEARAALVGHDWGAVATYLAAGAAPDRFPCIMTCAIPVLRGLPKALPRVPRQLLRSGYQLLFALPALPERWFGQDAASVVRWAYRTWSPDFTAPAEHLSAVAKRLSDPSLRDAALAYYRTAFRPGSQQRATLRRLRCPVTIPHMNTYGARDGCMDARLYPWAAGNEAATARLEGVGHFLHLEAPERFNACMLQWLQTFHPAR